MTVGGEHLAGQRQNLQRHPESVDDEGVLANLRQAGRDCQRSVGRVAERAHDHERCGGLTEHDERRSGQHLPRVVVSAHILRQHYWVMAQCRLWPNR